MKAELDKRLKQPFIKAMIYRDIGIAEKYKHNIIFMINV